MSEELTGNEGTVEPQPGPIPRGTTDQSLEEEIGELAAEFVAEREAPEPWSVRQNVAAGASSCDVRYGHGALERIGRDLRIDTGRSGRVALVVQEGLRGRWLRDLTTTLTDAGFEVSAATVVAADLTGLGALAGDLASMGLVAGDAMLAVGDALVLSLASHLARTWCGGVVLGCVPTTLEALVTCPATPYGLGVEGVAGRLATDPHMSLCFAEEEVLPLMADGLQGAALDGLLMGRVAMAVGGVCESQDSWRGLVMSSEAISRGDVEQAARQALDGARSRARVASSTSAAVRQALGYGQTIARGLERALGATSQLEPLAAPRARVLGEGMRIAARLAVEVCEGDVDFVFAQDGLLDRLGVAEIPCELEADQLLGAIKDAAAERSRRYQFCLPITVGRVRATVVEDDVLRAHLGGWCQARRALTL